MDMSHGILPHLVVVPLLEQVGNLVVGHAELVVQQTTDLAQNRQMGVLYLVSYRISLESVVAYLCRCGSS